MCRGRPIGSLYVASCQRSLSSPRYLRHLHWAHCDAAPLLTACNFTDKAKQASQKEMMDHQVPIAFRDSCAHLLIPLNVCVTHRDSRMRAARTDACEGERRLLVWEGHANTEEAARNASSSFTLRRPAARFPGPVRAPHQSASDTTRIHERPASLSRLATRQVPAKHVLPAVAVWPRAPHV